MLERALFQFPPPVPYGSIWRWVSKGQTARITGVNGSMRDLIWVAMPPDAQWALFRIDRGLWDYETIQRYAVRIR